MVYRRALLIVPAPASPEPTQVDFAGSTTFRLPSFPDAAWRAEHTPAWHLGLITGPSGTGKTSVANEHCGRPVMLAPATRKRILA